jgi:hypothetical protein
MKVIPTRVAKHLLGDNLYFGHSTLHDLLGKETLTSLMSFAVTGRRCTSEERELLDEVAVIMCSADPRIWPLKLTRLVSSYGGTLAGYAAAQLPMEGEQIGPWIVGHAADMLMRFKAALENQPNDEARAAADFVQTTTRFLGYGVPLRPSDERLDALNLRMKSTGRDQLPFWKLHERLAAEVLKQKNVIPNITVGFAAMLLDMGYTPHQAGAMTTFQNQNVFAANAYEAATQPQEVMRTLPDSAIDYVGQAPRISPRARAREISTDRVSRGNLASETS